MPYDSVISRSDIQALIPEQVSNAILENLPYASAAMRLFRRVPMSTNQTRMPVLAALPFAYFVNGDTGLKQTTEMGWENKYLNVEEIAVIQPIPEAVLDDAGFDMWGSIRPELEAALGRKLDAAVFLGTDKPASWPTAIAPAALASPVDHEIARGTASAATGGLVKDVSDLMAFVEGDGFYPNAIVSNPTSRQYLRAARDTTGQKYQDYITLGLNPQGEGDAIYGLPFTYAMQGLWGTTAGDPEMIVGDYSQAILGVRQDITYKVLDQAVITDNTGAIIYNLPQQDMVALRVTLRVAFQVKNTINYQNPTESTRYPFAVLKRP